MTKPAVAAEVCTMIGPWCFLDRAGPMSFAPDGGLNVGAHPHTGLQTVTWLFDGEMLHHDSLGNEVEDTYATQVAIRHNFTETLSGIAQYTFTDRVANIPGLSFTQNVFLLGLSKQF